MSKTEEPKPEEPKPAIVGTLGVAKKLVEVLEQLETETDEERREELKADGATYAVAIACDLDRFVSRALEDWEEEREHLFDGAPEDE